MKKYILYENEFYQIVIEEKDKIQQSVYANVKKYELKKISIKHLIKKVIKKKSDVAISILSSFFYPNFLQKN